MSLPHRPKKNHAVDKPPAAHKKSAGNRMDNIKLNRLLAVLPKAELKRWLPSLEMIDLPLGHVLYESAATETNVYFPTTAIVSLLYVMENGDSDEIAVVGNEGIVGISLFMGGNSTPSRAVVQSAGKGFRLPANIMKAEFDRAGLIRYARGRIKILDRKGLEGRVCECYAVVKGEYDRLLPMQSAN